MARHYKRKRNRKQHHKKRYNQEHKRLSPRGSQLSPSRVSSRKNRFEKKRRLKQKVRFIEELKLSSVKYFRKTDAPNAIPLSKEQVYDLRDKLIHSSKYRKSPKVVVRSDPIQKDNLLLQQKPKETAFTQSVKWRNPQKIYRGKGNNSKFGNTSSEKVAHSKRISLMSPCHYARQYQIPDQPTFLNSSFQEESMNEVVTLFKTYKFSKLNPQSPEMLSSDKTSLSKLSKSNQKQLLKKPKKGILKLLNAESSSSEEPRRPRKKLREEDRLVAVSDVMGVLGINIPDSGHYFSKLEDVLSSLDQQDQMRLQANLGLLKKFSDLADRVEMTFANINNVKKQRRLPSFVNLNSPASFVSKLSPQKKKLFNHNYKTVPCRLYHSSIGCKRGSNCDFIHNPMFKGIKCSLPNKIGNIAHYKKRMAFHRAVPAWKQANNGFGRTEGGPPYLANHNKTLRQSGLGLHKFVSINGLAHNNSSNLNNPPVFLPNFRFNHFMPNIGYSQQFSSRPQSSFFIPQPPL